MAEATPSGPILVTGAAGFIGSKVCQLLLAEGRSVVGIDLLNDAYDPRLKHWRLGQLEGTPGFSFHAIDITDQAALLPLFRDQGFGAVVNLAARAGIRQSIENPWVYFETNLTGTLSLLEQCREHDVKSFVLASTSSVYAEADLPFNVEARTDTPRSPYAASKKAAEVLCYTYHKLFDINVTIPRYFTVYGPAGRPDMSIFRFIKWIAEGEPLVLFGDGTQERDFTYVDDIARGTIAAMAPAGYQIINLGGDRPVSLNTVIALLEEMIGKKAIIEEHPFLAVDVPATWADISRARALGWAPQTTLEDGLRACVDWYMENREWAAQTVVR